jgi:hypothetical protein
VLPIIALDVDSYQHKVKEYGRIKLPKFTPRGWAPKAKFEEALAAAGYAAESEPVEPDEDYLSDEVSF